MKMNRRSQKIFSGLLVFLLINVSVVFSKDRKGIEFPSTYESDGNRLVLKGVGLKKMFFMKAFVAGFYLDETIGADNALKDVPKKIEVSYFVHIPGTKLTEYTQTLMQKNMTKTEYSQL